MCDHRAFRVGADFGKAGKGFGINYLHCLCIHISCDYKPSSFLCAAPLCGLERLDINNSLQDVGRINCDPVK